MIQKFTQNDPFGGVKLSSVFQEDVFVPFQQDLHLRVVNIEPERQFSALGVEGVVELIFVQFGDLFLQLCYIWPLFEFAGL